MECLTPLVLGQPLVAVRLASPSVLRTVDPPISEVLADRSLSRLLKNDWPRNIDEWET
jgi:hypothetical protein